MENKTVNSGFFIFQIDYYIVWNLRIIIMLAKKKEHCNVIILLGSKQELNNQSADLKS